MLRLKLSLYVQIVLNFFSQMVVQNNLGLLHKTSMLVAVMKTNYLWKVGCPVSLKKIRDKHIRLKKTVNSVCFLIASPPPLHIE